MLKMLKIIKKINLRIRLKNSSHSAIYVSLTASRFLLLHIHTHTLLHVNIIHTSNLFEIPNYKFLMIIL